MENFTDNFGWIEIALFYGLAIGVCFWQWWKMRREVREMRAERLEREAKEAAERKTQQPTSARPEEAPKP